MRTLLAAALALGLVAPAMAQQSPPPVPLAPTAQGQSSNPSQPLSTQEKAARAKAEKERVAAQKATKKAEKKKAAQAKAEKKKAAKDKARAEKAKADRRTG